MFLQYQNQKENNTVYSNNQSKEINSSIFRFAQKTQESLDSDVKYTVSNKENDIHYAHIVNFNKVKSK